MLYFANTLGAGLGAFLTGFLVLYYLGLTATIYVAAALNVLVSATVWMSLRSAVFSFPWWLSFGIGFLSLSEEILWVRVVGFRYQTLPSAFSFVLGCYLVGIALGAVLGKRLCERSQDLYQAAAIVLGVAAVADVLTPWMIAYVMPSTSSGLAAPALAIASTAALKSVLFPIVHHLGSSRDGGIVGRSVSRIYFGNIVGASLGPLVTGFVALDHLSVDECFGVVAALCLLASWPARSRARDE